MKWNLTYRSTFLLSAPLADMSNAVDWGLINGGILISGRGSLRADSGSTDLVNVFCAWDLMVGCWRGSETIIDSSLETSLQRSRTNFKMVKSHRSFNIEYNTIFGEFKLRKYVLEW